jgi:hypothetical protein
MQLRDRLARTQADFEAAAADTAAAAAAAAAGQRELEAQVRTTIPSGNIPDDDVNHDNADDAVDDDNADDVNDADEHDRVIAVAIVMVRSLSLACDGVTRASRRVRSC